MLYAWGFERVGVVAGDLYFQDPDPTPGQEGAERGVRLEVRFLERPPLTGSIYAAQPIVIDRPIWRADLLESVAGAPGSNDRMHHHPSFRGWEPGKRQFEPALSTDPIGWVADRLHDLPSLLAGADIDPDEAGANDASDLANSAKEIAAAVESLLARVRNGELAKAPSASGDGGPSAARVSWL
ncbi:MAG TPA: hypothetical protein VFV02_04020 [Acidimicrobiales bacterium]|nr:hypothetical protein [Acidimicrobiales bacterium]